VKPRLVPVGCSPRAARRGERGRTGVTRILRADVRVGPQPHQEACLHDQRKLATPRRHRESWGSNDLVVVLVDCSDCRSRREASGPSRPPRWVTSVDGVGSNHPASCSGGERAPEAGSRWQNREHGGGLSMIPCPLCPDGRASGRRCRRERGESLGRDRPARGARASSDGRSHAGERALVEGRRPGFDEAAVFDETAAEASLAAHSSRGGARSKGWSCCGEGRDRGRQRLGRMLGSRLKTPRPGGTVRRSFRSRLRQDRTVLRSSERLGASAPGAHAMGTGCDEAEAGGSPSSEASPG